ncbi:MAG: hypothetical protein ACI9XK_004621 [Granulosicoccus sp.]|jgi:hypothetical protein
MKEKNASVPSLRQKNLRSLAETDGVEDTLVYQQKQLVKMEKLTAKLKHKMEVQSLNIESEKIKKELAMEKHKQQSTASTQSALDAVNARIRTKKIKLAGLRAEMKETLSFQRDLKILILYIRKKEMARQKAVADFLLSWERKYDKETDFLETRLRVRKIQME